MRRALTSLLLAGSLGLVAGAALGCGSDGAGSATDTPSSPAPGSSAPESPSESSGSSSGSSGASADHELVELVTETAVGGEVGSAAVLSDEAAASAFLAQFRGAMGGRLAELLDTTEVPAGMVPYAAVVALGCDAPTDVRVTRDDGGVRVEAVPVAAPKQECLAAMTTVAFVLVPADAV